MPSLTHPESTTTSHHRLALKLRYKGNHAISKASLDSSGSDRPRDPEDTSLTEASSCLSPGRGLCWSGPILFAMPLGTLVQVAATPGSPRLDVGDLLCLTACATLAWQAVRAREEIAPRSQAVLLAVSLLWFASDPRLGYLAVTLAAIALLLSRPQPATARSAWLWLALSGHGLWGLAVLKLAAPLLMPVETGLVGLAAQVFGAAASVHGTRIDGPGGWYVYVLEGCSSLHGLSLDLLVWAAVLALAEVRVTFLAAELLATSVILSILANTLRILPMAQSSQDYQYWHNGWGASLFGVALELVAVMPAAMACRGGQGRLT